MSLFLFLFSGQNPGRNYFPVITVHHFLPTLRTSSRYFHVVSSSFLSSNDVYSLAIVGASVYVYPCLFCTLRFMVVTVRYASIIMTDLGTDNRRISSSPCYFYIYSRLSLDNQPRNTFLRRLTDIVRSLCYIL